MVAIAFRLRQTGAFAAKRNGAGARLITCFASGVDNSIQIFIRSLLCEFVKSHLNLLRSKG